MATRREFLTSCAALACAGGALSSDRSAAAAGEPRGVRVVPPSLAKARLMKKFTPAEFSRHLQSTFRVKAHASPGSMTAELIEVTPRRSNASLEQFSILFRLHHTEMLPQGTYALEHPEMGGFELFLVPVGRDDQGFCYEASFGYLRTE